jgi:SAM-dependent methyltransferase
MLPLIRCQDDGGVLRMEEGVAPRCERCGQVFEVDGPVLRTGLHGLHGESDHERRIRDLEAAAAPEPAWDAPGDLMEIGATLEALQLRPHHRLLELGAGRGRFTNLVAAACREVVAVDISIESLVAAAKRLNGERIALVHGDATKPIGSPGMFDRALGTLTSNLPDRSARQASYGSAAAALTPDGRFVFTTHYYGLRARMDREPLEGRYTEGGIYRRLLTVAEVREETAPYFRRVRIRPICVVLPFAQRVGLPLVATDRIARRVPLIRSFGTLLLVEATGPRRSPSQG